MLARLALPRWVAHDSGDSASVRLSPLRSFAMVAASSDALARAQQQAGDDSRGGKRKRDGGELKPYHAPWDTPPNHCIDLTSGRSAIDDKTYQEVWNYMSQPTSILKWRSECPLSVLLAVL